MRYAILSDIHGNLPALKAVLKDCIHQKVETFLCAGDIIGYGAYPHECIDIVRQVTSVCVGGNHDWAAAGRLDASYFTEDGKAAIAWTRARMSLDEIQYLTSLSLTERHEDFEIAHGSILNPSQFVYLDDVIKASEVFPLMQSAVCFVGHTHTPQVFIFHNDQVTFSLSDTIEMDSDCKYLINVGSVGQPRDGNPLASYCLYDTDFKIIQIKRQSYDIQAAQTKIIESGLPSSLAKRLAEGK